MEAAEIDKELDELQGKVEQLRALYEQYFMGFERMEPMVQRKDVERRIRSLRREQLRNTAQRFKLNTLVQRINTMQQHWTRVVREIENGTYRRDVIRAAARFGDGALAVLGQKKTREIAAAVAEARAPRSSTLRDAAQAWQRPATLKDTSELDDDDLIDDDAPTPPKLQRPAAQHRPGASDGLGQSDLPVVGAVGSLPRRVTMGEPPLPPVQRAVAFGELDLAFGELHSPLDDEPFFRAPPPSSPGSGIRPGANRAVPTGESFKPPVRLPAPVTLGDTPKPPGPALSGSELSDQRIRQICAQYVEAKRSTQESTVGVTFEKLAASLRAQADRLKSVHPNKSVDYEVVVRDGKTHLRPVLR